MFLYILRHADAQDHFNDHERPLSQKGIQQIESLTKFLSPNLFKELHTIYHSSLVRAQETAELFQINMNLKIPFKKLDGLEPWGDVKKIATLFTQNTKNCMIVGHNPHLEDLISFLMSGSSMQACIMLKKASMACLEKIEETSSAYPAGLWMLHWLISPKLLR